MPTVKQLSMAAIGVAVWTGITNPVSAITLSIGGTSVPGQGQFSSVPGVTTINFESGAPTSGPVIYSAPGIGPTVVSGTIPGIFVQPEDDATNYLTVSPVGDWRGNGPVTISFTEKIDYFGLYWGTPSGDNGIAFYQDNALLNAFTGNDVLAANELLGSPSNPFTNFFADKDESFDKIVLWSNPAFETDNHAYRLAEPVPEPTTILGTLAFSTFAARWRMKRKQQLKSLDSSVV